MASLRYIQKNIESCVLVFVYYSVSHFFFTWRNIPHRGMNYYGSFKFKVARPPIVLRCIDIKQRKLFVSDPTKNFHSLEIHCNRIYLNEYQFIFWHYTITLSVRNHLQFDDSLLIWLTQHAIWFQYFHS